MNSDSTFIKEIFPSIQGEGLFAGQAQVFLRLSHCNLDCSYCDTDFAVSEECLVYADAFGKSRKLYPNPLTIERVHSLLEEQKAHSSILVLTGGEPLICVDFMERLLPLLKAEGWSILLETNGTLADNFNRVSQWIDVLDMDIKLPSTGNQAPAWSEHQAFFENIPAGLNAYLKLVISSNTHEADLEKAAEMLRVLSPKRIVFLQPESKEMVTNPTGLSERLLVAQQLLVKMLPDWDIRILPQLHKVLGVL